MLTNNTVCVIFERILIALSHSFLVQCSDDAGFNDCFNSCFTVDEQCQGILKKIRGEVCKCNIDKRQQLLTVTQRHVNKTCPFGQKSAKVAQILLFGELPGLVSC